jgi:hypothetical protein
MDSLEVIYILDKDAEKYNLSKRVTEQWNTDILNQN